MGNKLFRTAVLLGLFTFATTSAVIFTFHNTKNQIAASEKQYLLKKLHTLIKADEYDNNIYTDTIYVTDTHFLNTPLPIRVYRARLSGKPIAAIITSYALDGYNGIIKILVGIYANGSLAGARIISHQETPGLGDDIDENKSNWIYSFDGKSLKQTTEKNWQVKKEGGMFDQFTGATITPRAVIHAIRNALYYFEANKDQIFSINPDVK